MKITRILPLVLLLFTLTSCVVSKLDTACDNVSRTGLHIVQQEESLSQIAQKYGLSVSDLKTWNGITGNTVSVCQALLLNAPMEVKVEEKEMEEPKVDKEEVEMPTQEEETEPSTAKTDASSSGASSLAEASKAIAAASYLRDVEKEMIEEINLLRSDPVGYIPFVEEYIAEIKAGKTFSESTEAADELVAELKKTPKLSILVPKECIYRAAEAHGKEAVGKGSSDHVGLDGSWPWDRVKRACTDMTDGNENLVGGPDNIRRSVMLLLVDDGIANRGHRKTLLRSDWKYVACYKSGQVGQMPNSWVQLFGL